MENWPLADNRPICRKRHGAWPGAMFKSYWAGSKTNMSTLPKTFTKLFQPR
ncbi:hypothetical protein YSA_07054 [Pseudomonas putida ND6]|uniref:Uncharacterized protein n=1 Tax=Pseudomonas putida ND6 TaxID=231023 RepID=I3UYK5_PSEPU|nr:hypothetical protein YSA_07054 [Pseudomonas putida ND6]